MKCTRTLIFSSFFGLWTILYKPAEWLGVEGASLGSWFIYSAIVAAVIWISCVMELEGEIKNQRAENKTVSPKTPCIQN